MGARTVGRNAALGASMVCASLVLAASSAVAEGLAIAATGPQSASPGSLVAFSFAVTNDGEGSFAEPVKVSGTLCQGPPALLTTDGGARPG